VWATSWGVSTRLMGALVMTHSDDKGLVLPPKLAPDQVVIVPIYRGEEQLMQISEYVKDLMTELRVEGISVKFDDRDTHKPGWKFAQYELQGVPIRLGIGPKDLEKDSVELARRDTMTKEFVPRSQVVEKIKNLLVEIQENLYQKALRFRDEHITKVETFDEFKKVLETKGGFISAHWDGTAETENTIKELTKATIRCIPFENEKEEGKCVFSGKPSRERVLFAKAY
ncbi:MAG TPA: His/Gly/Thr/Pro-type tRNA ligase C-terminal domain-containing protein, partial [Flavobacteriaceae bacterium]|nr:His/Gly/Thr/Pro-type tRNA ligase C-terminal domain-containing protein [Flavobacteriaceae bacterium]